jgi:hypothetical protein
VKLRRKREQKMIVSSSRISVLRMLDSDSTSDAGRSRSELMPSRGVMDDGSEEGREGDTRAKASSECAKMLHCSLHGDVTTVYEEAAVEMPARQPRPKLAVPLVVRRSCSPRS